MNVNDTGYQSMTSLLGESFRSDHDPDAGNISSRTNIQSSTGATHAESTRWVNAVVGVDAPEHSPNAVALRDKLHKLFEPHVTAQNRESFTQLIEQRAIRLNEMGETPESVEATLAKGQKLDRVSHCIVGAVRSAPFGAAARVLDSVPALTAYAPGTAMVGLAAGTIAGAVDVIGRGMLNRATSDTHWLTAKPEDLETVMADAAKAREPSLKQITLEAGMTIQTFSARNALRIGTAALGAEKMTEANAKNMDSWVSATGIVAAGSAGYLLSQGINERNHRTGPEYLLGRRDWETQYTALKDINYLKDPLINGTKRLAKIPVDMATDGLEATRKFFTAPSLMQNVGVLGGGGGATAAARDAAEKAAERAGFSKPAVAAISHTVNTVLNVPLLTAWTTASLMTGPAADKAVNYLQENASSLLNQAANYLHGRPSGTQPLTTEEPNEDMLLEMMEQGLQQPQNEAGDAPPAGITSDHIALDIVEEEPHSPVTEQPSHPLNNAERNM